MSPKVRALGKEGDGKTLLSHFVGWGIWMMITTYVMYFGLMQEVWKHVIVLQTFYVSIPHT